MSDKEIQFPDCFAHSSISADLRESLSLMGALNESLYCCCESYQELSFNDVGVSYSGLSGKSGNDFGSGYPFIPYINIFTNNIIDEGQLEYVQVREDESQNSVCFGDLLMTLSSETPARRGRYWRCIFRTRITNVSQ